MTTNVIPIDFRAIREEKDAAIMALAKAAIGADPKAQRDERKRLGRERAAEPLKGALEFKAEVRRRLALIAHLEGVPAMIAWVENECLAAWKVRSCTNE